MGHISFREYPTFDFIAPDRCIVKARAQLLPISLGGGIHVMRIGIQLAPFLNTFHVPFSIDSKNFWPSKKLTHLLLVTES